MMFADCYFMVFAECYLWYLQIVILWCLQSVIYGICRLLFYGVCRLLRGCKSNFKVACTNINPSISRRRIWCLACKLLKFVPSLQNVLKLFNSRGNLISTYYIICGNTPKLILSGSGVPRGGGGGWVLNPPPPPTRATPPKPPPPTPPLKKL